jgi:hypothetical protein
VAAILALACTPIAFGRPRQSGPVDEEAAREEQRQREIAERAAEGWRRRGLAAVEDMAASICQATEQPHLARAAEEELRLLGPRAVRPLVDVAARRDRECGIGSVVASIVCDTGRGEGEVLAALADDRRGAVSAGLAVLRALGRDPDEATGQARWHHCQPRDRLVARALPAVRKILLDPTHGPPVDVLWTVHFIAADATALVPAIIVLLERDERTAVAAAETLGDFGAAAAPAVPALRRLLRAGEARRLAAVHGLGAIGRPARPSVADMERPLAEAVPRVCRTPPRFTEDDALAVGIVHALIEIGGREAAQLVPLATSAYDRLHTCRFDIDATERRAALRRLALCARDIKGYPSRSIRPDSCR